ncbi:hypothetical protein NL676_038603 [Syzygium grande]|nr:hypothetical protein NL676_038603 [Syzygium grande]
MARRERERGGWVGGRVGSLDDGGRLRPVGGAWRRPGAWLSAGGQAEAVKRSIVHSSGLKRKEEEEEEAGRRGRVSGRLGSVGRGGQDVCIEEDVL